MSLLDEPAVAAAEAAVAEANTRLRTARPGPGTGRQPVHTVYGGGHLFRADTVARLGDHALRTLERYAPDPRALWTALGGETAFPSELAESVAARVHEKLRREPVEDFRADFEDGYGVRSDADEDRDAAAAAREMGRAATAGVLPPFAGIRVKSFADDTRARALRTLEVFVGELLDAAGGLPTGFLVTLPKITGTEQVRLLVAALEALEARHGLAEGALRLELMIETPQSIVDLEGRAAAPALVDATGGRCFAVHFGTYDYTASLEVTAAEQTMDHPVCDHARHVVQVALAGAGVFLSDGATNVLPVPPHRGDNLNEGELFANRTVVHAAWALHHQHVRRSLRHAWYQGWDLHPAQLPSRFAAVYGFFLEGVEPAAARLRNFVGQAAQATLVGEVFDDAATGQGLLNYFLRALNCGALDEAEVVERTGLTPGELRTRSFVRILAGRRGGETP